MSPLAELTESVAGEMSLLDIDWDEFNLRLGNEKFEVAYAVRAVA